MDAVPTAVAQTAVTIKSAEVTARAPICVPKEAGERRSGPFAD